MWDLGRVPRLQTEAIVLLGSTWAALESAVTRWHFVAPRLMDLGLVEHLTLVDFPHFRRRAGIDPRYQLVAEVPPGPSGLSSLDVTVPLGLNPRPLERWAWRRTATALEAALEERRPRHPKTGLATRRVVIATNPLWVPLLPYLRAEQRGFDADDDWRFHPATTHLRRRVVAGYEMARSADSITANSAVLADTLRVSFGAAAEHVGNGADLASFAAPGPVPSGLPSRPFAVYVGSLQSRVDLSLLEEAARHLADEFSVVVAGPAEETIAKRLKASPMQWLGPVPHEQVPGLLSRASVGLIPHRVDQFTSSMEPLKLFEYLAAGLPVVATQLPGLASRAGVITLVSDATEMSAAIRRLVAGHKSGAARQLVAGRDWNCITRRLAASHMALIGQRSR